MDFRMCSAIPALEPFAVDANRKPASRQCVVCGVQHCAQWRTLGGQGKAGAFLACNSCGLKYRPLHPVRVVRERLIEQYKLAHPEMEVDTNYEPTEQELLHAALVCIKDYEDQKAHKSQGQRRITSAPAPPGHASSADTAAHPDKTAGPLPRKRSSGGGSSNSDASTAFGAHTAPAKRRSTGGTLQPCTTTSITTPAPPPSAPGVRCVSLPGTQGGQAARVPPVISYSTGFTAPPPVNDVPTMPATPLTTRRPPAPGAPPFAKAHTSPFAVKRVDHQVPVHTAPAFGLGSPTTSIPPSGADAEAVANAGLLAIGSTPPGTVGFLSRVGSTSPALLPQSPGVQYSPSGYVTPQAGGASTPLYSTTHEAPNSGQASNGYVPLPVQQHQQLLQQGTGQLAYDGDQAGLSLLADVASDVAAAAHTTPGSSPLPSPPHRLAGSNLMTPAYVAATPERSRFGSPQAPYAGPGLVGSAGGQMTPPATPHHQVSVLPFLPSRRSVNHMQVNCNTPCLPPLSSSPPPLTPAASLNGLNRFGSGSLSSRCGSGRSSFTGVSGVSSDEESALEGLMRLGDTGALLFCEGATTPASRLTSATGRQGRRRSSPGDQAMRRTCENRRRTTGGGRRTSQPTVVATQTGKQHVNNSVRVLDFATQQQPQPTLDTLLDMAGQWGCGAVVAITTKGLPECSKPAQETGAQAVLPPPPLPLGTGGLPGGAGLGELQASLLASLPTSGLPAGLWQQQPNVSATPWAGAQAQAAPQSNFTASVGVALAGATAAGATATQALLAQQGATSAAGAGPYTCVLDQALTSLVTAPVTIHPPLLQHMMTQLLAVPSDVHPALTTYVNTWLTTYWVFILQLAADQPGLVADMARNLYAGCN